MLLGLYHRCLGRPVYFYQPFSEAFAGRWRRVLNFVGFTRIDFQSAARVDTNYIFGDRYDVVGPIVARFLPPVVYTVADGLLAGIANHGAKLRTLVRAHIDSACAAAAEIATWCAGRERRGELLIIGPLGLWPRRYLEAAVSDLRVGRLAPLLYGLAVSNKLLVRLWRRRSRLKKRVDAAQETCDVRLPGDVTGQTSYEQSVLFFPHQTIRYGNLFLKDHFYNSDRNSPFHSSKILHVELGALPAGTVTEDLCEIYERHDIRYCRLNADVSLPSVSTVHEFVRHCWRRGGFTFILRNRQVLMAILRSWSRFRSFCTALKPFNKARIALVGYEMLFPKELSLALEARGIRTVATQERFLASTFYRNWNYILDTYLVASRRVCEEIDADESKLVKNCIPVGLVRADLILQLPGVEAPATDDEGTPAFEHLVVAYDFPSLDDRFANMRRPVANWASNRQFYEDILRLAREFPHARFVVRSRQLNWLRLAYFQNVINALGRQDNVVISEDFARYAVQYRLGASADLVIAKHSSIAEELIAAGKPVILHDYICNASTTFSQAYAYEGVAVFARSYNELAKMTHAALENGDFLAPGETTRLRDAVNNGLADGKVGARIQQALSRMHDEQPVDMNSGASEPRKAIA